MKMRIFFTVYAAAMLGAVTVHGAIAPYAADGQTIALFHFDSASAVCEGPDGLGAALKTGGVRTSALLDEKADSSRFSTKSFTIEAWIRWSEPRAGYNGIFRIDDGLASGKIRRSLVQLIYNGKTKQFELGSIGAKSGTYQVAKSAELDLAANGWVHVAVTFDNGTVQFYADPDTKRDYLASRPGTPLGGPVAAGEIRPLEPDGKGQIAVGGFANVGPFGGAIDEVRWSNGIRQQFSLMEGEPQSEEPTGVAQRSPAPAPSDFNLAAYEAYAPKGVVPAPRFHALPFGAVRPSGWLAAQINRDVSSGAFAWFDRLSWTVQNDAFGTRGNNPNKKGNYGVYWDGAHEGYWLDALVRMAYLSSNVAAQVKADHLVKHILATQDKDGYIGIFPPNQRYQRAEEGEMPTKAWVDMGLIAYAQVTGRAEVLDAVEREAQLTMRSYTPGHPYYSPVPKYGRRAGVTHGLLYGEIMELLWKSTGKEVYRNYGHFYYDDYNTLTNAQLVGTDMQVKHLLDPDLDFQGHGVHTAELLRFPLWAWCWSGDATYKQAFDAALRKLDKHLSVSGSLCGNEDIGGRHASPDFEYEFCSTTELMISLLYAAEKTGEPKFADMAETAFFNAAAGARLPDGKAHSYLTADNRISINTVPYESNDHLAYSPSHFPPCCTLMLFRIAPYYVQHMWMKTGGGDGLAAVAYGPCSVTADINGVPVRLQEETDYPFEDAVTIRVSPEKPCAFDLWLKKPVWSSDVSIKTDAKVELLDGYYWLRKTWKPGDEVAVNFGTPVQAVEAGNGSVALKRGALVYAFKIPEKAISVKDWGESGLHDWSYEPTQYNKRWSGYCFDRNLGADYGFTAERNPEADLNDPWTSVPVHLKGSLLINFGHVHDDVTLVPMGSAILRKVTLPVGQYTK